MDFWVFENPSLLIYVGMSADIWTKQVYGAFWEFSKYVADGPVRCLSLLRVARPTRRSFLEPPALFPANDLGGPGGVMEDPLPSATFPPIRPSRAALSDNWIAKGDSI